MPVCFTELQSRRSPVETDKPLCLGIVCGFDSAISTELKIDKNVRAALLELDYIAGGI
jgi:hypothetical protein